MCFLIRVIFFFQASTHQDFGSDRYNRKRPRESDNFNNDFNFPQNDCEEFRPMQVIDYQNRTLNQSTLGDQTPLIDNRSSHNQQFVEDFPRKIIEYDHKSKIHPWSWFCPVIQIEYNHSKNGFSLHEHPPPRPAKKDRWVKKEPTDEFKQLRQPKWAQQQAPVDRQERPSYGPQSQHQQQHFQSRYENRQTIPPANEIYYRRNPQDRNPREWNARNPRDWNAPYDK